ncbi:ABC transporter permease [Vibrio nigripulchritudo]|uniref:ABC transporter permease n=1 Tax=Vibrio nigripulchritudo TaxID=28173 RepID=UPI002491FFB8|nr:FtsX-like permease family protein [Vibrio nigripulchritudo]BDU40233.1 hypothetical protein TUMSATVNIG2_47020 [Vibrio nigripulchritudo]BDU45968.1 hypothetical protein TUMSATVNIG3_47660 [Vibrio nigripulchritudo]
MSLNENRHIRSTLAIFVAHYRQAPLQAVAILIGIVLAVTLFVAVQAINLNAKRSYAESTEQLSGQAQSLILPLSGQHYLPESVYFSVRQAGLNQALPVIEGRVRDNLGRRWSIQGSDLISAITSQFNKQVSSRENTVTKSSSVSLFDSKLPLARLLAGEPLVLVSQSHHESMGGVSQLILEGVETDVIAVPDQWQLGSRMLMDIGFAQQLMKKEGKLSYIAVFDNQGTEASNWERFINQKAQLITNTQSTDLGSLTDSFHLNLTAMSMLAFLVGLFIAYNGVKYSLLKRNRLLVQIQQAGITQKTVFASLLIELIFLVTLGSSLGFVMGIQLSHWLHPMVALTLEQLYGATLLPGTWFWHWWLQALGLTLVATLAACWQHFKQRVNQTLSSHSGLYQTPENSNENRLFFIAVVLSASALTGLWASDYFRFTMVWLGVLIVSIPLFLPKAMSTLSCWAVGKTTSGLMLYLFAELKELIAPLSLAMMALLLAVTANIGMNTLVGSFEFTLKQWLEKKLHADIYVSPSQSKMAEVEQALYQFEGVDKVYKQYYVDEKILGLPTLLGTKDPSTLEQTMVFKSHTPDFWDNFYSGKVVAISEPTAVKLNLELESDFVVDTLSNKALKVGAIFHDYGSPNGEVLISPDLWNQLGFSPTPTSLGVKVSGNIDQVQQELIQRLELHSSQLYDQAEIKSIALEIFSRTFSITSALNGVTLLVAVIGLFSACFMLLEARKAAIARLHAIGVSRAKLMGLVLGQIAALVAFTLMVALPLGAIVGYVLTDIITLRAFGWSLNYLWSWSDTLVLVLVTHSSALVATALPLWRLVSRPLISSLQSEVL